MVRSIAIVLAAGSGSRMGIDKKKQFLELGGKPLMCHSIEVMEQSPLIDDIIVVTGKDDVEHVDNSILKERGYSKVRSVIPGGDERYISVWNGIKAAKEFSSEDSIIYIHDSARPFVSESILERARAAVDITGACVVGMPAKDTIRLSDDTGCAGDTIPRDGVWLMQTPQVFKFEILYRAFEAMMKRSLEDPVRKGITDDVMVVKAWDPSVKVELVEGSQLNLKVTTREDLILAEGILGFI